MKKHFNLIAADLPRLLKSLPIKIILGICAGYALMMVVMISFLMLHPFAGIELPRGEMLFRLIVFSNFAVSGFGIFIAIAIAIFTGGDYSFNTFRNKIVAGNSRLKIYLSALTIAIIIGTVLFLLNLIVAIVGAAIANQGFYITGELAGSLALIYALYLAIIATIVFVSMCTKAAASGIGINLGITIGLSTIMTIMLMFPAVEAVVMAFPHGIIDRLAMDAMMMMGDGVTVDARFIWVSLVVSAVYFSIFTVGGILRFKYMDLK